MIIKTANTEILIIPEKDNEKLVCFSVNKTDYGKGAVIPCSSCPKSAETFQPQKELSIGNSVAFFAEGRKGETPTYISEPITEIIPN